MPLIPFLRNLQHRGQSETSPDAISTIRLDNDTIARLQRLKKKIPGSSEGELIRLGLKHLELKVDRLLKKGVRKKVQRLKKKGFKRTTL